MPRWRRTAARAALVATAEFWEAATVLAAAVVLAHQGGWDEMLLVATPVGIFAGLLWVANRRAESAEDDEQTDDRLDDQGHHHPRPSPES